MPVTCPAPQACACSAIARHTRPGVAGIARSVTPSGASALITAFMIAAGAPIVPASPQPLAPSGLCVQSVVGRQVENRNVVGPGQTIVHQRAGAELAALSIINRVSVEGLADALDQPAVHLALDNQRVDDAAEIVGSSEI